MGILRYAPEALKNLFRPPVTTAYPAVPMEYPEGTRGHIEIEIDECIGCGMCVRCCPCGTLEVDKIKGTWSIDRFDCIACGYCVVKCPKKCLSMNPGYQTPDEAKCRVTYTKSPETLEADRLKREEQAKKAAAAKAAALAKKQAAETGTPEADKPKEAKQAAGTPEANKRKEAKQAAGTPEADKPIEAKQAAKSEGTTHEEDLS